MMNIKKQYSDRYIKVKPIKTRSGSSESKKPKRTVISRHRNDPYLWYMVKEKKIDLYKDLGIRLID
jgi:hypothetical protein